MQTIEHLAQGCNYPDKNMTNTTIGCIPTSVWNQENPNASNINFDATSNYIFNNKKNHICTYTEANNKDPEIRGLVAAAIDTDGNKNHTVNCVNIIPDNLKNSINQTHFDVINNYKIGYKVTYKNSTDPPVSLSLPANCPNKFSYNNGSNMDIPEGCYIKIANSDYANNNYSCPLDSNKMVGKVDKDKFYCY
jgi:hypothetical protein